MRTRVAVSSLSIALAWIGRDAHAGATPPRPPVRVVVSAPPPNAQFPDDLPGPQDEVTRDAARIDLPAVPAFELPASEPGFHGPRELRVHGRALAGTELKVKGHVTWIYDCAAELARSNRNATAAEIAESIDHQPELCDGPMFSLGETRDTPRDGSIWVVDVPRPPNKAERAQKSRAELEAWPAVPRLAVGDHVVVTGTWAIESPHGERNAGGLLVYRAVERQPPSAANLTTVAAPSGLPEIAVVTEVPLRTVVDTAVRNASVQQLNTCNRAIAARQYDAAIPACRAATDTWPDNHLAWYAWASAHLAKGEWRQAQAAIAHAVTLRPDVGMYQLYDGMARYEAAREQVRDQARKHGGRSGALGLAPPVGTLDAARDALLRAVRITPALWRAHYYLGRIYGDLEDARRAAEQLTQTIALHPRYCPAYLALIELYRRWGYLDHAIAIATLGTTRVTTETADLWFELAMAHDARRDDAAAIAALGKALASRPDDASSLLQRGQIYLRKGEAANARRDLEQVARSTDPRTAVARRLAGQLLALLATRSRAESPTTRRYKKVYRPAEEPYEPWSLEDAKYRGF